MTADQDPTAGADAQLLAAVLDRNVSTAWLVEEASLDLATGDERVDHHSIVFADGPLTAFFAAAALRYKAETGDPWPDEGQLTARPGRLFEVWPYAFGPEELEEVQAGYLWEAGDGSCVAVQVRRLGPIAG